MQDGDYLHFEVLNIGLLRPLNLLSHLVGLHLDNDLLASLFPYLAGSQGDVIPLCELLLSSLDTSRILHLLLDARVRQHNVVVFELEAHFVEHLY